MRTNKWMAIFMVAGLACSTTNAADKPEEIVTKAADLQNSMPVQKGSLEDRWARIVEQSGWGDAVQEGGVMLVPDRNLIISSAMESTRVPVGQPGWIEARVVAFERAELQAKAKIVRYFSETTNTSRSLGLLEGAGGSHGTIAEIQDVGEVAATLEKIAKKSVAATEALLDQALQKLDPKYDPTKYDKLTPQQLQVAVEETFKRRITSHAFQSLVGVTPMFTTEGEDGGQYQVLVGVIWSPRLNNVALGLGNDVYNLPPVQPNAKIETTVPTDPEVLLGTMGTRIVVDEKGQFAVVAYGQAQPRRASAERQQSAVHTAKQVAASRARAQIVNFVKESLTAQSSETASELSREYSDLTVGTESIRNYQERIAGSNVKVSLRGLRTLKEWDYPHPLTGEIVTGAVLAWSPSSAEMASGMEQVMKDQARQIRPEPKSQPTPKSTDKILESMPVNTGQY